MLVWSHVLKKKAHVKLERENFWNWISLSSLVKAIYCHKVIGKSQNYAICFVVFCYFHLASKLYRNDEQAKKQTNKQKTEENKKIFALEVVNKIKKEQGN